MTLLEQEPAAIRHAATKIFEREAIADDASLGMLETYGIDGGETPELMGSRMLLADCLSIAPVNNQEYGQAVDSFLPHFAKAVDRQLHMAGTLYTTAYEHVGIEIERIAISALLLGKRKQIIVPTNHTIGEILWGHWVGTSENTPVVSQVDPHTVSAVNAVQRLLHYVS